MRTFFKADISENIGQNWFIANFGMDEDGNEYILTTDHVHASEVGHVSDGAKADCELVATLLNMYHTGQIRLPKAKVK